MKILMHAIVALLLLAAADEVGSSESASQSYRLIGAAPASLAATASSPAYSVYVVGGAGQAVGISASANTSVNAGGASNLLPTARIFRNGMEP